MHKTKYDTKSEAIKKANEFLQKVKKLQNEYGLSFNSDTGDVYLSYQTTNTSKIWDSVKVGWKGDGSGIMVMEKSNEDYMKSGLKKLNPQERKALNLD